jgi:hypothetical protein
VFRALERRHANPARRRFRRIACYACVLFLESFGAALSLTPISDSFYRVQHDTGVAQHASRPRLSLPSLNTPVAAIRAANQ